MNLSNKQIQALVKEIFPSILELQKKNLESRREIRKKEIEERLELYKLPFEYINCASGFVKGLQIDIKPILEDFGINKPSTRFETFDSLEKMTQFILGKTIKNKFEEEFGEEVTQSTIEHEIILSTIGAENIKELIETVKSKFIK